MYKIFSSEPCVTVLPFNRELLEDKSYHGNDVVTPLVKRGIEIHSNVYRVLGFKVYVKELYSLNKWLTMVPVITKHLGGQKTLRFEVDKVFKNKDSALTELARRGLNLAKEKKHG